MNKNQIQEKARQIASGTFSDGTMRTMLYERIVDAFAGVECRRPHVRPGHHPPCKAMLDDEAECTCGQ